MKFNARIAATIVGWLALGAAVGVWGCQSSSPQLASTRNSSAESSTTTGPQFGPAAAGDAQVHGRLGLEQRNFSFADGVTAGVPEDSQVPQIDLQSILQQGQGGGQSPFADLRMFSKGPHSDPAQMVDAHVNGVVSGEDLAASLSEMARQGRVLPGDLVRALESRPETAALARDYREIANYYALVRNRPARTEITLLPGEELWVIEKRHGPRAGDPCSPIDDAPGSGALMTRWCPPGESAEREVPIPLAHTDVKASIACNISSVEVTQTFANPFSSKIEAVYVFPLPDDAAVSDFVMTIGTRKIRAVIREREEARQIYEQAKHQGHHAALLSQERSNIFTQRVANIEPGEKIDITITYFGSLTYRGGEDGGFEFVFPMVVGPRFNPPANRTNMAAGSGVGAVAYGQPAAGGGAGQATNVSYLRPSQRSGHDISLSIEVDAGVPIERIESPSHTLNVLHDRTSPHLASVRLDPRDDIPNRDFVLRYRVAGGQPRAGMVTHVDQRGGFFSMLITPPDDLKYLKRDPVEFVFVIDTSGSMSGSSLELAKGAVESALRHLRPEDSFQVVQFAESARAMSPRPLAASWESIDRGIAFTRGLSAGGGTMMITPMRETLDMPTDWKRRRFVCFLTDGFIGNESEVLGELRGKLGEARVFSIGIGNAPNRTLLNAMARLGRGASAYLSEGDNAAEVMDLFMQRVCAASMSNLKIDFGGLEVSEVYPSKLPDLYVDRPILVTGRFKGSGATTVKITGKMGERGEKHSILVPVDTNSTRGQARGLPMVWARQRIAELDDRSKSAGSGTQTTGWNTNQGEIKDIALRFGLVSAYTSLVAVDGATRTSGTYGTTVAVPVNVPVGTRYDTTVQER